MHVIYRVIYRPHLGTQLPKYYIGSKYNYKTTYYGSVASSKPFDFTGGLTLKNWWKTKLKETPKDFLIEILESYEDIDKRLLVEREYYHQLNHNCVNNPDYFNTGYANPHWVSDLKSDETKAKMAKKTKEYWDSPEGIKKRKRLSERNKAQKSEQLRVWWEKNPEHKENVRALGRKPKSKETREKMSKPKSEEHKQKMKEAWIRRKEKFGNGGRRTNL